MKLYVALLSAIIWAALVWTAPVDKAASMAESDQNEIELAKRAKETIMFGNQQNPARVMKRNPVLSTDDDSHIDLKGQVLAMPARDTPEADTNKAATDAVAEIQPEGKSASSEASKSDNADVVQLVSNNMADKQKGKSTDSDIDTDVKEMLESGSEAASEAASEEEQSVDETGMVTAPSAENSDQMDDFYKYLMRYENVLEDAPYSKLLQQYSPNYFTYRRRRSILRNWSKNRLISKKAVKRAKRIKRDLFDGEDEYYYPYEVPPALAELGYGDVEYYPRIEPEVNERELLASLLSLYDDEKAEEPIYEIETPYQRVMQEAEEPVYVPVKRQMLSSLPGFKKRYFYPVNKEPQTHWGAFVPEQKREYYDAYDRVLRVARALADDEREYYTGYYDGYKKK